MNHAFLIALGGLLLSVTAAPVTVTIQRQLGRPDGVVDATLYAPRSVANVNYGATTSLGAGVNRWGESYASLLRFDLGVIPSGTQVRKATVVLHRSADEYPKADQMIQLCAISLANGAWIEGDGTGERVPMAGTPSWNWRSHGKAKWVGKPGLNQPGVDFLLPAAAGRVIKVGTKGDEAFEFAPAVVRRWIADPTANAGLVIRAEKAAAKGSIAYFVSSDEPKLMALRPKLVLTLEMTDGQLSEYRTGLLQARVAILRRRLASCRKECVAAGNPPVAVQALARLEAEAARLAAISSLATAAAEVDATGRFQTQLEATDAFGETLLMAQAEVRAGDAGFALSWADSGVHVFREPRLFRFRGDVPKIHMAGNEFEAFQAVVIPIRRDLPAVTWQVGDLMAAGGQRIPAADVKVSPVGYLKTRKPAIDLPTEWVSGPILDFLETIDVAQGTLQPLWVLVRSRADTPPGIYQGTLTVTTAAGGSRALPFEVEVFGFAVPKEQHLLTIWGNNDATFKAMYGAAYDSAMAARTRDFLLEHRLAFNTLYAAQSAGKPIGPGFYTDCIGYPSLADPADLRKLWEQGSRWWSLGYLHPVFPKKAGLTMDEYIPKFIEMMRNSLAHAEAAGWPRSNLGIYFFDETKDFAALARAASKVKAAFPDIPLMTTGYDRSYGVKGGPVDQAIDIWCPLTPRFVEDMPVIEQGRQRGKKAWWYVCCGPRGKTVLNFFCQYPPLRSRLLMGAATWKYQPDGFLYYRISGWRFYKKPISSGPLTAWEPYYQPGPDGDGELICPGPKGALSTVQFENLRDGIEDYEYWWLLRDRLRQAKAAGRDVGDAETLLAVPPSVLEHLTRYSEEPGDLRGLRLRLARAIEGL